MEEKNDGDDEKNLEISKNEVSFILYFFCKNPAEFFCGYEKNPQNFFSIYNKNFFQFVSILKKIRFSLSDDRQLSIFEISISGLVPALLNLVKLIEANPSGILAELFTEVFLVF